LYLIKKKNFTAFYDFAAYFTFLLLAYHEVLKPNTNFILKMDYSIQDINVQNSFISLNLSRTLRLHYKQIIPQDEEHKYKIIKVTQILLSKAH